MTVPRSAIEVGRPDPTTIELVRRSCASVAEQPLILIEAFYRHLFALAPQVRPMFPADMTPQNEKLGSALLHVVGALDDPDWVERMLRGLGAAHHRRHGVLAEHYPYVGRALVRAVRDVSGEWSTATGSAWVQVYEWMAGQMIAGAENAEHSAPAVGRAPVEFARPRQ